jgi:NAD(P)H-hydrate epimerase
VVVVCGKGNNGGDGFVVARLLREAARDVAVVCLAAREELAPDARANLERLPGAPPLAPSDGAASEAIAHARVIVDALLGTGFSGVAHGTVAKAIEAIDAAPGLVLSVDVPSGVDASTGVVAGPAIKATKTATFHVAKPGLWIHPGKGYAGEVDVIDIGIPRGAPGASDTGLIRDDVLDVLPSREAGSTKFSSGHVIVVGGSRGLMGGLAGRAAGRRRLRDRVCACLVAAGPGCAVAGGDDPWPG